MQHVVLRLTSLAAPAGTAIALLMAAVTAFGQPGEARAISDGIFSPAQVERGRESFTWECIDCHEIEEFTGVGAYFETADGKTVWEVFEFIWAEMPEDKPAWLDPEEYADILAYLLSVYGLPSGEQDMPTDKATLDEIILTRPDLPGS
jgi:mono/diheme cytochrome c family protein